jgi:hypothetical protein
VRCVLAGLCSLCDEGEPWSRRGDGGGKPADSLRHARAQTKRASNITLPRCPAQHVQAMCTPHVSRQILHARLTKTNSVDMFTRCSVLRSHRAETCAIDAPTRPSHDVKCLLVEASKVLFRAIIPAAVASEAILLGHSRDRMAVQKLLGHCRSDLIEKRTFPNHICWAGSSSSCSQSVAKSHVLISLHLVRNQAFRGTEEGEVDKTFP